MRAGFTPVSFGKIFAANFCGQVFLFEQERHIADTNHRKSSNNKCEWPTQTTLEILRSDFQNIGHEKERSPNEKPFALDVNTKKQSSENKTRVNQFPKHILVWFPTAKRES